MKGFGDQYKSKDKIKKNTNPPKEKIINQAFKFHSQGNISEASKYYQYFIEQGFKDFRVFSNYGVLLKDLGKFQEAELFTRKAIEINPDYAIAHSNLGIILRNLGKLQEAELSARKAIEINPDFADGHYNLGNILKDLGKFQEAEISYRKAIKINPDYSNAHSNLGNILKAVGNFKEAELSTRKAIEINPDFAEAHSNLGIILRNLGKLQEAELSTRKAIEINPNFAEAHSNLGNILTNIGKLDEAELSTRKAIEIKPDFISPAWNLYALANSIEEAEVRINQCLKIDENFLKAKLTLSALKLHQGDNSLLDNLIKSTHKNHPYIRSIKWVSTLPNLPKLFFHRWALFDSIINESKKNRPFYEFGVWRGVSFKYLINTFKKGYGFDTFEGIPEDWHQEKQGTYSADGFIPKIAGGTFIAGKFEDTLPTFFAKPRPMASLINFDADLYSSTICALNYSKSVIDKDTILIFDEFIINENWEQDEYRALNEFCYKNNLTYEVLAVSYITKQVAVKLIGI